MTKPYHNALPFPFEVGDVVLENYRIEAILGSIGSVWYLRASYELAPQVGYAVQVLPWSGQENCPLRDSFMSEPERLSVVACPPFVPVIRSGVTEGGHAVIVREFLEATTVLDARKPVSLGTVRTMRVIECVSRAMAGAHQHGRALHGFTHFDVMLNSSANDAANAAFMLDAPHALGAYCADDVRVHGSLQRYHAPEFRKDRVSRVESDVYALGMLAAVLLFGGAHRAFVKDPENHDFEQLESFRPTLLRALSRDPAERFESTEAFVLAARESAWRAQRTSMDMAMNTRESRIFARRSSTDET